MINFKRDGTKVIAEVQSNIGVKANVYCFEWRTTDDCYAALLQENLQQFLRSTAEKIRRESYEKGYKDAKAKRKRETWFSGWF